MWQDIRYGIRSFVKSPGFAITVILTIALGIAANTSIFTVVNAVLLRPLRYPAAERLVMMQYRQSVPDLADIAAQVQSFESMGGATIQPQDYTGGAEPLQVQAALITSGLMKTLGVKPLLGRVFRDEEDRLRGERLVVLQHSFWQQQLGGDPGILGKMIPLSGVSYRVIGVLEPAFKLPLDDVDMLALIRVVVPEGAEARGMHALRTYALLKDGVTLEAAQSEMSTIDRRLEVIDPVQNKDRRTVLVPLHTRITGQVKPALLILFSAVCFVLLIACSNFANLMLARGTARQQEMAVRISLGAGRWRLLRQLLTESVIIAIAGGLLGLLLATWALDVLKTMEPGTVPRLAEISIDGRILLFTLSSAVLVGLLSGFIPAWSATRTDPGTSLKESGRSTSPGAGRRRLRSVLVVTQLALAVLLLIGAGLLIKAFVGLRSVDPGINPENVVTFRIQLPEARYTESKKQEQFRSTLLHALNSRNGIAAGAISELPFSGEALDHNFVIVGRPPLEAGTEPSLYNRSISGKYMRSLEIPIIRGRDFAESDHGDAEPVGIVNEAMVRQYFPDSNPIGAQIKWAFAENARPITIVGIATDVKHFGLDLPEEPAVYTPFAQTQEWKRWMALSVRSKLPSSDVADLVKQEVWKLDPQLPVTKIQTMKQLMATSLKRQEFNTLLLAILSFIALGLALVGLYGAVSYTVGQRSHEIGIRMALGADTTRILKLVIGEGALMTGIGIFIGLVAALALTRLMAGLLFGVSTTDPSTFLSVILLLSAVALLASTIPAIRASKVDPVRALRNE